MPRPEQAPPDATDCVFCTLIDQPAVLFETASLIVMPDKYPTFPGHMLIITKAHTRCYAQATDDVLAELAGAVARVRRFMADTYGASGVAFENGVAGQTVFHAHMHVFPMPFVEPLAEMDGYPDVTPAEGWDDVRAYFARHGGYRYFDYAGRHRIIAGDSPVLDVARRHFAEQTGVRWGPNGAIKTTTAADVRELERRWSVWVER